MRNRSRQPAQDANSANDQSSGSQDVEQRPGSDEMLDEDAIERFGRDLDDADVAARALGEDQEDEYDEGGDGAGAGTAAPPAAAPV